MSIVVATNDPIHSTIHITSTSIPIISTITIITRGPATRREDMAAGAGAVGTVSPSALSTAPLEGGLIP